MPNSSSGNSSPKSTVHTPPFSTNALNEYYPTGLLKKTYGARTYPVEYTYDYAGRVQNMTTWRKQGDPNTAATTTWNYDSQRGWLQSKSYAGNQPGPSYTYTAAGRLASRTWARGVVTTNTYTAAGDLQTVSYLNDPANTPGLSCTYDRRGRLATVTQGAMTTTFSRNSAGQVVGESYIGGLLQGLAVTNLYDGLLRRTALGLGSDASTLTQFRYDDASRLSGVINGTSSASYGYLVNSPLVQTVTFKQTGTTRLTATRQYDFLNRLTSVQHSTTVSDVAVFGYQYNAANQRTAMTNVDHSRWVYTYDGLGQVTSGKKSLSDGSAVAGQQFEYAFDDIGNRTTNRFGGDFTSVIMPSMR